MASIQAASNLPAGPATEGTGARALRRARWVQPGEQLVQLPEHGAYLTRRQLHIGRPVRRAVVHATALGVYELQVNGRRVGDALLRPGWTDSSRRVQYQSYDVSSRLAEGVNVLGAIVAPGWYAGRIGTDRTSRLTPRTPELLLCLEIETDDGCVSVVPTDEAWEWRASEVLSSDLYDGEVIDLRIAVPGWGSPDAGDLGTWESMEISPGTAAALVPEIGPPLRETQAMPAEVVSWPDDRTAVLDLGRNESGFVRLRVEATAGTRVIVSYGELLDVDGRVYTENLRSARCRDTFFCAGGGIEELAPRFTFRGARYAQVTGLPGQASLVSAERAVIGTDVRRVGWFESSDPLLNDIYAAVLTSQRANFLEVPTDCPQRDERLGWMADALLFAPLAAYNYDICDFMAKWFEDILDARTSAGGFTDVAPRPTGRVLFRNREGAPAWADAGVLLPWLIYQRYGRKDLLERMFPAMVSWLRIVHEENPDGVWRHQRGRDYGDWVPAGPDTSHDLFATAWLCHSTETAARAAAVLDAPAAEQAWLGERAGISRRAFSREFVDAGSGRVRALDPVGSPAAAGRFAPSVAQETQTGYVLALMFDLADDDLAPRLASRLAELVRAAGSRLETGFIGSALLLDALAKGGQPSLAIDLLLRDEYPSLGYMMKHGATSIWERWDGIQPAGGPASATMNSFNHYCLGSMFHWAIESVCGLRAGDQVAFGSFRFAPTVTTRLDWAAFRFASPSGEIRVRWERSGDSAVTGEVTVPDGVTCEIAQQISFGDAVARLDTSSLPDGCVRGPGAHYLTWRA